MSEYTVHTADPPPPESRRTVPGVECLIQRAPLPSTPVAVLVAERASGDPMSALQHADGHHVADCLCGWWGPERDTYEEAEADRADHWCEKAECP